MSVPWYLMAKGKGGGGYKTASGPIVSVNDALAAPLRSLLVNIEPVQAGTGDPSPDNVRPISGWSAVNVWRTGVNVWDEEWEVGSIDNDTGVPLDTDNRNIRSKNFISIEPRTTYYFYIGVNKNIRYYYYDESKAFISTNIARNSATTTPSNARWLKIRTTSEYGAVYNNDISINYPSTDHDYHPYSGNQYTLQLGQTVYGGTLDVTNGVLTVDRAMVDLGTLGYSSGFSGFYTLGIKDDIKVPTTVAQSGLKSDIFIVGNTSNADNMYIQFTGAYVGWVIFLPSATYATAADFKTAMNGHQLVYELATPITIPLTPQEISTLQGQNNVWADSGDVTVEYLASGGANAELMKLAVAFMGRK